MSGSGRTHACTLRARFEEPLQGPKKYRHQQQREPLLLERATRRHGKMEKEALMALRVDFTGIDIKIPGDWSGGMTTEVRLRYRLIGFITKLGVKTFMSKWLEYE